MPSPTEAPSATNPVPEFEFNVMAIAGPVDAADLAEALNNGWRIDHENSHSCDRCVVYILSKLK